MTTQEPSDPADPNLEELVRQIAYLQEALTAIGSGGVDAVVLGSPENEHVYAITNADRPYRVIVERMGEGAATVSEGGVILFANPKLAEFIGVERDSMIGRDITAYIDGEQQAAMMRLLDTAAAKTTRAELSITALDGSQIPALVSATALDLEGVLVRCLVFTDLTMQKQVARQLAEDRAQAERQRFAREVNDTIVQGLVTAEMAMDLEQHDYARDVIATTSERARAWIGELAEGRQLQPGMAVRRSPAGSGKNAG